MSIDNNTTSTASTEASAATTNPAASAATTPATVKATTPATAGAKKVLPAAEKSQLRIGYMRLTDSAPLIIAQELGYFAEYGLDVELETQSSWANVRDKVAVGYLDAAQMLAPMPLTTSLGIGGVRTSLITGLSLSLNGNAITVSNELYSRIQTQLETMDFAADTPPAKKSALALAQILPSQDHLTLATVHPFSTHSIMLRMWLEAAGIDPDASVRTVILPPEQMVDSLGRGMIDGFCVGAPWNTRAIQYGLGSAVATGYQIWNNAPEKVLGVKESWHSEHPQTHLRLRLALMKAGQWLDRMENRPSVARILAKKEYLDLPEQELLPGLTGQFTFSRNGQPEDTPTFHRFSDQCAGFPWRSNAEIILNYCGAQIGRDISDEQKQALIQQCYRTDLFREAARELGIQSPNQDYKKEGGHTESWVMPDGLELGPDKILV